MRPGEDGCQTDQEEYNRWWRGTRDQLDQLRKRSRPREIFEVRGSPTLSYEIYMVEGSPLRGDVAR